MPRAIAQESVEALIDLKLEKIARDLQECRTVSLSSVREERLFAAQAALLTVRNHLKFVDGFRFPEALPAEG